MTRLLLLVLVSCALTFSGCTCVSNETKAEIHHKAVLMEAFVKHMDSGSTAREDEQEMLRADLESWLVLDAGLNGDEDAKALLAKIRAAEKEKAEKKETPADPPSKAEK